MWKGQSDSADFSMPDDVGINHALGCSEIFKSQWVFLLATSHNDPAFRREAELQRIGQVQEYYTKGIWRGQNMDIDSCVRQFALVVLFNWVSVRLLHLFTRAELLVPAPAAQRCVSAVTNPHFYSLTWRFASMLTFGV